MYFSPTAVGVTALFILARLAAATSSDHGDVAATPLSNPVHFRPAHLRFAPPHRHEGGEDGFVSHYYRHRLTDDRYPSKDKRSVAPQAGPSSSHTPSSRPGASVPNAHTSNGQQIRAGSHSSAPIGGIPKNKHKRSEPGQVPSLTSSNNFINFCSTVPHFPITNGQHINSGSCNPVPMGVIPKHKHKRSESGQAHTPSSHGHSGGFVRNSHINGQPIRANSQQHPAPAGGMPMHRHRRRWSGSGNQAAAMKNAQVQALRSKLRQLEAPRPPPTTFRSADNRENALFGRAAPASYKVNVNAMRQAASNNKANQGVSSGLPAGNYRMTTINTAANHQPVLKPVAQRGAMEDARFFHQGSHH